MPVPALLKTAWEFPPTRALMIRGGAAIAGGIAGKLIGSPETEQYRKQLKKQMDLLQKQMAGLPTPASKAVQQTIRQQSRQAQQSLAASAQGAGQTGTSVSRAIQARELGRQAEQQATAKGQLSIAAQQQYTQLLGAQEAMAREERGHIQGILNYIMQGVGDAEIRELLMEILRGNQRSTFAPGEAGSAQDLAGKPPSPGEAIAQAPSLQTQQAPSFQQQLGPVAPRAISLHEASIPTEPTTLTQYTPTVTPEYVSTGTVPTAPRYERPGLEQFPRTATDVTPTTFEPRETLGAQPPMQGPQPPPREVPPIPTLTPTGTLPPGYESIDNIFSPLQSPETTQPVAEVVPQPRQVAQPQLIPKLIPRFPSVNNWNIIRTGTGYSNVMELIIAAQDVMLDTQIGMDDMKLKAARIYQRFQHPNSKEWQQAQDIIDRLEVR